MDGSNTCWGSCQKHTLPESTLLVLLLPHLSCITEERGEGQSHRTLIGNGAKAMHCSTELVSLHENQIPLTPGVLCMVVMEFILQQWGKGPLAAPSAIRMAAHGQGTEGGKYRRTHRSPQTEHKWGSVTVGQERVSFIHYKYMDLICNGYIRVRMDGQKEKKAGESAGRKEGQTE